MSTKLEGNTKFSYTLSSKGDMVRDAIHSIRTLQDYVKDEDIIVIFTPPKDQEDVKKIESLGVQVREKDNIAETFKVSDYDDERNYGDKMWICEIGSENVVFLDCDTLVLGDIWKVLEGDFEFKARFTEEEMVKEWSKLFSRHQEPLVEKMFNAGFFVFKNGAHKRIESDWKKYYNTIEQKSYSQSGNIHLEQYALTMAVAGLEREEMSKSEHLMEWTDEVRPDSIVHHLSGPQWTYKEYLKELFLRTKNLSLEDAVKDSSFFKDVF